MSQPDFFAILGVPRRFRLDASELERRFHDENRRLHPDRHVKSDAGTRVRSALATSQLNEAYRTLRDPTRRAEHLLALEGIAISDERSGHKVGPAFLAEILELREALLDARTEGDADKVESLAREVRARRDEELAKVEDGFSKYEAGSREALPGVADALIAERYFRRFLDEVEAYREAREAG